MQKKKSYLTPNQVAELLMVSPSAIRLWSERGELKAMVTAGGHRRFKLEDIKQFALDKNIQLNISGQDKMKILIVDDDKHFATFLRDVLEHNNKSAEIRISYSGFEAGLMMKEFEPTVILLDIRMPGMNGFEVCKKIKQDPLLKHIRVLGISGGFSEADKQQLIELGAERCLDKPVNIEELNLLLNA